MQSTRSRIIELAVERFASAALAGSCAFAAWAALGGPMGALWLAIGCSTAILVYFVCLRSLARIDVRMRFVLPSFETPALPEPIKPGELLLTEAHCLRSAVGSLVEEPLLREVPEEPLMLDDVLARLDAGSRVVRLFDPARMPTPGQLDARIREHLNSPRAAAAPPDASQMLHDALAELRRSLR